MTTSARSSRKPPDPKVGIFWLVRGRVITFGYPLSKAAAYGEFATYEPSHLDKWGELQRNGAVPPECEYEEFPRGRVMFNRRTETFLLLADKCILRDKRTLSNIMKELGLPATKTGLDRDSHYRCFRCLENEGDGVFP